MSSAKYEKAGNLAVVSLSLADATALDRNVFSALRRGIERVAADRARALLIRTDGPVFASGFEISIFRKLTRRGAAELFRELLQVIHAIEDLNIPTIAAVHGTCLGGGLELALACDLIIAREDTRFGQVEVLAGGTTFLGGVHRLAARCGVAKALEIAFTGSLYSAAKFEDWGIVNRTVPAHRFCDDALDFAHRLADGPTAAHAITKQLVRRMSVQSIRETDAYLLEMAPDLVTTGDMQAAVEAIMSVGLRKVRADPTVLVFKGE